MTIPTYWKELAGNVGRRLHYGKVMVTVLGASDTGKTTLSFYLAKELLSVCGRVSIVSADMGQGAFGPPATVSMALLESVPKSIDEISTHSMYFVGSTSPVGHFLQTLTGVKKLVDRASGEGAKAIIIDTTGLVSG
ncbi:MAG: Clp1/GlmU family protein, partial [Candidatus Brocadiales bacterium]